MIYVNEDYENYKYLVSIADNYIVLTNQKSAGYESGYDYEEIDIIYQYFYPSSCTIQSSKNVRSYTEYQKIDISTDFFDRADCSFILLSVFFILMLAIKVINMVTEFVERGGIIWEKNYY